jgi:hypothetical protein
MNIFKKWRFGLICAAAFMCACASSWQPAPAVLQTPSWSLCPPAGWMRLTTYAYDMFSKDGPYLQYILIQGRPLDKEFGHTRQKLQSGMLAHEAAQVLINEFSADSQMKRFKLLSSEPVSLSGHMGFKLDYTYLDAQDVPMRCVYYGVVLPDQFFNLRYTAAHRYYFPKDLAIFEQVRRSVRLPVQNATTRASAVY